MSSSKCLNFIKEYEKCYLKAYWDSNGYSIGYGHHSNVKANDVITVKKANALLSEDVKKAEKYVNYLLNKLPYTLKQTLSQISTRIKCLYELILNKKKNG